MKKGRDVRGYSLGEEEEEGGWMGCRAHGQGLRTEIVHNRHNTTQIIVIIIRSNHDKTINRKLCANADGSGIGNREKVGRWPNKQRMMIGRKGPGGEDGVR